MNLAMRVLYVILIAVFLFGDDDEEFPWLERFRHSSGLDLLIEPFPTEVMVVSDTKEILISLKNIKLSVMDFRDKKTELSWDQFDMLSFKSGLFDFYEFRKYENNMPFGFLKYLCENLSMVAGFKVSSWVIENADSININGRISCL